MIRLGRRRLVWLSGFVLVVAGVLCLCLSALVVHEWWQGTLQAFGVGFVVGGVVDVLAISGLNQAITGEEKRRQYNFQARLLLGAPGDLADRGMLEDRARDAGYLLEESGGQIDRYWRDQLQNLIDRAAAESSEGCAPSMLDLSPAEVPRVIRLAAWPCPGRLSAGGLPLRAGLCMGTGCLSSAAAGRRSPG